ncbi:MAG TPA: flagellar biosynthetic protein FliR, partial [Pirellulales bacterium]|nr:flagellar biosynthetic protein FliR [Pirellulales bacterium]
MNWFLAGGTSGVMIFMLLLARTSGLMIVAPVVGASQVPQQVRALLAIMLALVLLPTQWAAAVHLPETPVDLVVVLVRELLLGLVLGLGVSVIFSGLLLAGQLIGQMSGMSLAEVFDPSIDSMPLFSEVLQLFATTIFVTVGGHRLLVQGLLDTFSRMPPGQAGMPDSLVELFSLLVTQSMELGIRAAAPASVALLLATVVLGLVSRTLPQLNVLSFGFGLNAMATFGALAVSLGSIAWLFVDQVQASTELIIA